MLQSLLTQVQIQLQLMHQVAVVEGAADVEDGTNASVAEVAKRRMDATVFIVVFELA